MKPFLYETAEDIIKHNRENIHNCCFIFPNKRTRFFFKKYYSEIYGKAHKAPLMTEIRHFVRLYTKLEDIEKLNLVFELYDIFKLKDSGFNDDFDSFYKLGEIVLSDFNEIDSWLVNPQDIYRNIRNLKEIDSYFDWLTEEQIEILKHYWVNFSGEDLSEEKKTFLNLWNILPTVHKEFTERLLLRKTAYNGLQFRYLSELIDSDSVSFDNYEKYFFIGFNALNKGEIKLFKSVKKLSKAYFYWNTDAYYHNDLKQEAGDFLRLNFKHLNIKDEDLNNNFLSDKTIDLIGVPLNINQAKILPDVLSKYPPESLNNSTAVLLGDEHLLFPVISSIPEEVEKINVSMGYPLISTVLYRLVVNYINLHIDNHKRKSNSFYYKSVISIIQHPYVISFDKDSADETIQFINERNYRFVQSSFLLSRNNKLFNLLFSVIPDQNSSQILLSGILNILFLLFDKAAPEAESQTVSIKNEFIYKVYTSVKRIRELLKDKEIDLSLKLCGNIIIQSLRSELIPFEGEAVDGLQLMGILESRNLDFENVVILGMNEGIMPRIARKPTFISQSLRYAFDMPMLKHQDAVYAYIFYGIIQRAKNITLIYNNVVNENNSGELSRFILQLLYETDIDIKQYQYNDKVELQDTKNIIIEKDKKLLSRLFNTFISKEKIRKSFSAASLNAYLDCSLKFYFKYVAKLKEKDVIDEEFSPSMIGSILHTSLENIYNSIILSKKSTFIEAADLEKVKESVPEHVKNAFEEYFKKNESFEITGSHEIIYNVIQKYVLAVLMYDIKKAPFEILSLEETDKFKTEINIKIQGETYKAGLEGRIDRIDKVGDVVRIIDYKSGTGSSDFNSVQDLFDSDKNKRPKHIFQMMLYSYIRYKLMSGEEQDFYSGIYYIRDIQNKNYEESIKIKVDKKRVPVDLNEFKRILPEFENLLQLTVEGIFNAEEPFKQTSDEKICEYCSYKRICNKDF